MNKRAKGTEYEDFAAKYLESMGLKVIFRNFRCRLGEIDIIATDKDGSLVFVEVKYRSTQKYGSAASAVDIRKQKIISKVSDYFRISHKQFEGLSVRFDVIAFENSKMFWYKNAFEYSGAAL